MNIITTSIPGASEAILIAAASPAAESILTDKPFSFSFVLFLLVTKALRDNPKGAFIYVASAHLLRRIISLNTFYTFIFKSPFCGLL